MADDGETKDDVKVPDGEVGEKIDKLFTQEEKDTSRFTAAFSEDYANTFLKTSSFSQLWVSRLRSKPRRLLAVRFLLTSNTFMASTLLMA